MHLFYSPCRRRPDGWSTFTPPRAKYRASRLLLYHPLENPRVSLPPDFNACRPTSRFPVLFCIYVLLLSRPTSRQAERRAHRLILSSSRFCSTVKSSSSATRTTRVALLSHSDGLRYDPHLARLIKDQRASRHCGDSGVWGVDVNQSLD